MRIKHLVKHLKTVPTTGVVTLHGTSGLKIEVSHLMRDPHPLEGKILFSMNARNAPSFPCPSPPGVYHLRTPKSLFFMSNIYCVGKENPLKRNT